MASDTSLSARFAALVVRHHKSVLLMVVLLTAVLGAFALRVSFDSSVEMWFLESDPGLEAYHEFVERFDADEAVVIAVFADDVYDLDVLRTVQKLTAEAAGARHVHQVRSLANVRVFSCGELGAGGGDHGCPGLAAGPVMPSDLDSSSSAAVRRVAEDSTLLRGTLVSTDGKVTVLLVELEASANDFVGKTEMISDLREIVKRHQGDGVQLRLAGTPLLDVTFLEHAQADSMLLIPLAIAFVFLVGLWTFRRFSTGLIPLAVILIAMTWMAGLMGIFGEKFNVVSSALTALVMAVGVADSIHVISDYHRRISEGLDQDAALREALSYQIIPCFFTSATTIAGLLSLSVSDLAPIRAFAWISASGVGAAFIATMTFVPAMLRLVPSSGGVHLPTNRPGPMTRITRWLGLPSRRRQIATVVVGAALTVAAIASIPGLPVESNVMEYFRSDNPFRRDHVAIDEALGGTTSVELIAKTVPGGFKEPKILRRLEHLQQWVEGQPGMQRSLSIVDSLKDLDRLMTGGGALPDSSEMVAQYYLLFEGEEAFDSAVQDDYALTRVTARANLSTASSVAGMMPELDRLLAESYSDSDLTVTATGYLKLLSTMDAYLISSLIESFILAFIAVTLMIWILLGSWRLALLSLIPNVPPIVVGLAAMKLMGFSLNPGTAMVASIALGLVVDDTVHYLVSLKAALGSSSSFEQAVVTSMERAARPIVITSVTLIGAFVLLASGSFMPNVSFGLITAVVVSFALVADLMLLPAALLLLRPRALISQPPR